jgi:asparagine synthase (glutamine-hydrolysing)
LYQEEGLEFLKKLNGFFALALYDSRNDTLILARDKYGIKPLLFLHNEDGVVFSSEMKALLEAVEPQELDHSSLRMYFRLTFIPPPYSIFKNIQKLIPGCYLIIQSGKVEKHCYFTPGLNRQQPEKTLSYPEACTELHRLLHDSVERQLISDVPIGCFLSGGIDSSIISTLAAKYVTKLKTFSIGFRDEPYYDETAFAEIVAKKIGSDHISFSLTNDDLFSAVEGMLNYIDEPFADSSALAVYVLSGETAKHVTVALSGDGADEMFGGYNRHMAEYRIRRKPFSDVFLSPASFFLNVLPASRNGLLADTVRKTRKYLLVKGMSPAERYMYLSSFNDFATVERMVISYGLHPDFEARWKSLSAEIGNTGKGIEDVMLSDMQLLLPGDMLPKVDMMSMAHSLEVRPPFLDDAVVHFAFSIPTEFKISGKNNKRILRDTFRQELPSEILSRNKHGFEVPMNTWFRGEMRPMIDRYLQSSDFIDKQKLFRHDVINAYVHKALTTKHHDLQSFIWSLLVFQHWYEKYEHYIKKDWL